jgi:uncharacterized protein YdiU (UPF0061 family)
VDWAFDNTFARELDWLGVPFAPLPVAAPSPLLVNDALAFDLGLDPEWLASTDGTATLAGNTVPEGAQPMAQAYAGHQFGGAARRGRRPGRSTSGCRAQGLGPVSLLPRWRRTLGDRAGPA